VHPQPPENDTRRSFLKWATHGLGALFAAVIGTPAVMYLIDFRNRPTAPGDLRPVRGLRLSEVPVNQPDQGVIRNVLRDAWTLYPDDVLGRVWVVREKAGTDKDCYKVFTTVCPHLGCSVNCNNDQQHNPGFTCPCHDGRFNLDGTLKPNMPDFSNAPPRGMDALEFEVAHDPDNPDPNNRDLLRVKYEVFQQGTPEKKRRA
jgi:menaquinol-cytochrome c reductase iron-sulfur subunit